MGEEHHLKWSNTCTWKLAQLKKEVFIVWEQPQVQSAYFKQVHKAWKQLTKWNVKVSDDDIVIDVVDQMYESDLFSEDTITTWEEIQDNDKTLSKCQKFFENEYIARKQYLDAKGQKQENVTKSQKQICICTLQPWTSNEKQDQWVWQAHQTGYRAEGNITVIGTRPTQKDWGSYPAEQNPHGSNDKRKNNTKNIRKHHKPCKGTKESVVHALHVVCCFPQCFLSFLLGSLLPGYVLWQQLHLPYWFPALWCICVSWQFWCLLCFWPRFYCIGSVPWNSTLPWHGHPMSFRCLVCCAAVLHNPLVLTSYCCSHIACTWSEYADTVGTIFVGFIMFNVCSACGKSWSHNCIRKVLSTPARIALKWFECADCFFWLCFVDVYVVVLFHIQCHFIVLCWGTCLILHCWVCVLSSCLGLSSVEWFYYMPCTFPLMFWCSFAQQWWGSHPFCTSPWCIGFLGWTQLGTFLSGQCTLYFHVINVYTYFLKSVLWCMDNICIILVLLSCLDCTPCHCSYIWLLCSLDDPRKCFAMAVTVSIGCEVKNPAFIALSKVDCVRNPDATW